MKPTRNVQADLDVCREVKVADRQVCGPLWHRPQTRLIVEADGRIEADLSEFHRHENDPAKAPGHVGLLTLKGCRSATVEGEGLLDVPFDPGYVQADGKPKQWRSCIHLAGSSSTVIKDLVLSSRGGDGITVDDGTEFDANLREPSRATIIENVSVRESFRNGLSLISCDGLVVDRFTSDRSGGVAGEAGIVVEPNRSDQSVVNVVIRRSHVLNAAGWGFQIQNAQRPAEIDVSLDTCTIQGGAKPAFHAMFAPAAPASCRVSLLDCNLIGGQGAIFGASYLAWSDITMVGGSLRRLGKPTPFDLYLLWDEKWKDWPTFTGLDFGNLVFQDVEVPLDFKAYWYFKDQPVTGCIGRLIRPGKSPERCFKSGLWMVPR